MDAIIGCPNCICSFYVNELVHNDLRGEEHRLSWGQCHGDMNHWMSMKIFVHGLMLEPHVMNVGDELQCLRTEA